MLLYGPGISDGALVSLISIFLDHIELMSFAVQKWNRPGRKERSLTCGFKIKMIMMT